MDWQTFIDLASKVTATALLSLAVVGVVRGWWIPGYIYRDHLKRCSEDARREREEKERWIAHSFDNLALSERAADLISALGRTPHE